MSVAKISSFFFKVIPINKNIRLRLNGKSLLIIGKNGCGKTSLLTKLHEELKLYASNRIRQDIAIKANIANHLQYINEQAEYAQSYRDSIKSMKATKRGDSESIIRFTDAEKLAELVKNRVGALVFFPANRKADIRPVEAASSVIFTERPFYDQRDYSQELEQHLVNLKIKAALESINGGFNPLSESTDRWLTELEQSIRYLLEDESAEIFFNSETLRYEIKQLGRPNYLFQDLSSGYSSIIDIYANLAMRLRRYDMAPTELQGIVIIDEIDAHLHVSLQRKIFPFLIKSFPNVQFIVSTHSPFVVSSVDDVIIYDLSTGRTALDLSMYSVDSIIEGLLGVPIISKKLEDDLFRLRHLTNSDSFDISEAEQIVMKIAPHADSLDDESRLHYELARKKLLTIAKVR